MTRRRFPKKIHWPCGRMTRNGISYWIHQSKNREVKRYILKHKLKIREIVSETHKILPRSEYRWPVYGIRWDYIRWIYGMDRREFK